MIKRQDWSLNLFLFSVVFWAILLSNSTSNFSFVPIDSLPRSAKCCTIQASKWPTRSLLRFNLNFLTSTTRLLNYPIVKFGSNSLILAILFRLCKYEINSNEKHSKPVSSDITRRQSGAIRVNLISINLNSLWYKFEYVESRQLWCQMSFEVTANT